MTRERDLRWLLVVGILYAIVTAACIAWIDEPLARWLATFEKPAIWSRIIQYLEYGAGVEPWKWTAHVVLVAAVFAVTFVPALRRHAPAVTYVAATHLLARNLMLWMKTGTGRLRPGEWLRPGGDSFFEHGVSFPSGHVVIFASLAIPIAIAWPRARIVLLAVPLSAIARVAAGAHFASDATGAIALVCLTAWACGGLIRREAK